MQYKLDEIVLVKPIDPNVSKLLLLEPCIIHRIDEVNQRITVEFEGLRYNLSVSEVAGRPV